MRRYIAVLILFALAIPVTAVAQRGARKAEPRHRSIAAQTGRGPGAQEARIARASRGPKKGKKDAAAPHDLEITERETYRYKEHDFFFGSSDGSPTNIDGEYLAQTALEDAAGKEDATLYCDLVMSEQPACPLGDVAVEASIGGQVMYTDTVQFFQGGGPGGRCFAFTSAPADLRGVGRGQKLKCSITVEDDTFLIGGADFIAPIASWEVAYPQ
jgi:hypothetical protein